MKLFRAYLKFPIKKYYQFFFAFFSVFHLSDSLCYPPRKNDKTSSKETLKFGLSKI